MKYTKEQIDKLIKGIYLELVNVKNLPKKLYIAIADYLKEGVYKGFGGSLIEFGGIDLALLKELRENAYIFSGAKTYQQIREMSAMASKSQTFSQFKKIVTPVYEKYNNDWLQTEYNTAVGQAQNANLWLEFEKDKKLFPYLKYSAVIDSRTSQICKPLDGIIRKVGDPIWSKYSPLNHFNCRCTLEKISIEEEVTITSEKKVKEVTKQLDKDVQKEFKMNSGKGGYIFNKDHPYFKVAKKDVALAKNNFGLPIPNKD